MAHATKESFKCEFLLLNLHNSDSSIINNRLPTKQVDPRLKTDTCIGTCPFRILAKLPTIIFDTFVGSQFPLRSH